MPRPTRNTDCQLVEPALDRIGSYFDLMDAARREPDTGYRAFDLTPHRKNPGNYLRGLYRWKHNIDLGPGLVPMDTWWLIHPGRPGQVLGETRIRHALSPSLELEGGHVGYLVHPHHRRQGLGHAILRLALRKLAGRGISQVLVTCDAANVASARIIEAAGGQFDGHTTSPRRGVMVSRYWIANPVNESHATQTAFR